MQSFLQYSRLRKVLKEQLASKDESAAVIAGRHCSQATDLERGEQIELPRHGVEKRDMLSPNRDRPSAQPSSSTGTATDFDEKSEVDEPTEAIEEPRQSDEQEDNDETGETATHTPQMSTPRLSRASTEHSIGVALGQVMTGIKVRKRKTNEGGSGQVFVVTWQGMCHPSGTAA